MLRLGSFGIVLFCTAVFSAPASAQGVITITQEKALAGGVTPGDAPGFPITITQPGSYRLDSTLRVGLGKNGIRINAQDVLIDLNGFSLYGQGSARIGIIGELINTTVRNGTITGFTSDGIRQTHFGWVVEKMRIERNGGHGVRGGAWLRVADSAIVLNGGSGIITDFNQLAVRDSTILSNLDGIACGSHCHIQGNLIHANKGRGVFGGIMTVLGNTINSNTGFGIEGSGGFGNNSLQSNNGGSGNPQVSGMIALHPNVCDNQVC